MEQIPPDRLDRLTKFLEAVATRLGASNPQLAAKVALAIILTVLCALGAYCGHCATATASAAEPVYRIPKGELIPDHIASAGREQAPMPRLAGDMVYRLPEVTLIPQAITTASSEQVIDWGHAAVKVSEAWKKTRGKGARIAILDTGIDASHPDFPKSKIIAAKNFTDSPNGTVDVQGHGTHCAGIASAADNGYGVVGVAPEAELLVGKILGDGGSGLSSWIVAGIDWAVANKADVISMSIGSPSPDPRIQDAIRRATSAGIIVVCAAGNSGPNPNTVDFPGGFPESVCVAATTEDGMVASFSSRGEELDVAAPGKGVRSSYPGNRVVALSGTSMATPYVAGVAALYVSSRKADGLKYSLAEFRKIIEQSSVSKAERPNPNSGWGLIQAPAFVGTSSPTPTPTPTVVSISWNDLTGEAKKRLADKLKASDFRLEFTLNP